MKYYFSKLEREKICEVFENGAILKEIGKIFQYSITPITRILVEILGVEKYKELAKEHSRENGQKMGKLQKTKTQIKTSQENGRKNGSKNLAKWRKEHPEKYRKQCQKTGSENVKKMHEWNAKNHNFISRPEALFYITVLSKNFFLKDIKPQYYIKEINHRVDFAVPSQKLLFEVDGDYYHNLPDRKEKDSEVNKWAKDNGWTIFRYNDAAMRKFGVL